MADPPKGMQVLGTGGRALKVHTAVSGVVQAQSSGSRGRKLFPETGLGAKD